LLKAVKAAKDVKMLPNVMFKNNSKIPKENLPDRFTSYFEKK
jgi:hypothetical protein